VAAGGLLEMDNLHIFLLCLKSHLATFSQQGVLVEIGDSVNLRKRRKGPCPLSESVLRIL
jgi:hypothetical protein